MNATRNRFVRRFAAATVVLSAAFAAVGEVPQLIPAPRKLVTGEGEFVCKGDVAAQAKFVPDAAIPKEGYRLSVAKDGITVVSSDDAGRFYALETLKQLAVKDGKDGAKVPCVEIEDSPRYSWRGFHLDECRHFFGKETVKSILDLMARYKLNRFHWHLTEDQGWRVDVPGYPARGTARRRTPAQRKTPPSSTVSSTGHTTTPRPISGKLLHMPRRGTSRSFPKSSFRAMSTLRSRHIRSSPAVPRISPPASRA